VEKVMEKLAEKQKENEVVEERFGDVNDIEYIKPEEPVNMREYTLYMPDTFPNGFKFMKKMVEMVRLEECDVENKNLFELNLPDFREDVKQKERKPNEKDSWVACVQTRFLFASDFDCGEIDHLITKFYTLSIGER
jgi:hypothetical protein